MLFLGKIMYYDTLLSENHMFNLQFENTKFNKQQTKSRPLGNTKN